MAESNRTIDVTNIPLMLSTSRVCQLTGLTDEYLCKLEESGLVTSFQKRKRAHKYWRRDEVLTLLGFVPITK